MASIIYVASPLSFSLAILLFFNFQHGIRARLKDPVGDERKYWGCCRPLRLLKSTSLENIEGVADLWDSKRSTSHADRSLRLGKKYKPQRIFVGFTVLCETFFELKKSFFFALFCVWAFICSIFVGVSTTPFGDRANKCFAFFVGEWQFVVYSFWLLMSKSFMGQFLLSVWKELFLEDEELLGE